MKKEEAKKFEEILNQYREDKGIQPYELLIPYSIEKWLEEQIEPDYPCPICGEEMYVGREKLADHTKWFGQCYNYEDCWMRETKLFYSKNELRQALKKQWRKNNTKQSIGDMK